MAGLCIFFACFDAGMGSFWVAAYLAAADFLRLLMEGDKSEFMS